VLVARPVRRDEIGLDEPRDVRLEREGHDVGRKTRLDGAALLA
jgi:hypothetical protein